MPGKSPSTNPSDIIPRLHALAVAAEFCTHVVRVELVGPCCRAVLGAQNTASDDGSQEVVINARLVLTPECAVALAHALLAAVHTKAEPDTAGAAFRVVN
jgi:hypothetical protein